VFCLSGFLSHGVKLLKKEVDPETKGKQQDPRKDDLPARVVEFPNDSANVETKAGRVANNARHVKLATGKGGLLIHCLHPLECIAPTLCKSSSLPHGNLSQASHDPAFSMTLHSIHCGTLGTFRE
jgi:hypothetical protein